MILIHFTFAIVNIGYKLALNDGMPHSILVAYKFMFGVAFIVHVSLFVERNERPRQTRKTRLYAFLCGLTGRWDNSRFHQYDTTEIPLHYCRDEETKRMTERRADDVARTTTR
ncbi:hypothetical protein ACS0TY_002068 [Phlomoides rotata]